MWNKINFNVQSKFEMKLDLECYVVSWALFPYLVIAYYDGKLSLRIFDGDE